MENVLSPVMALNQCNFRKIYKESCAVFRLHTTVIDLNRTDLCHTKCRFVRSLLRNNMYMSAYDLVL